MLVLNQQAPTPPSSIFGSERLMDGVIITKRLNWRASRKLADGGKTGRRRIEPGPLSSDRIEWMPFLQSYAVLGELDKVHHLVSIIDADPFSKMQACQI